MTVGPYPPQSWQETPKMAAADAPYKHELFDDKPKSRWPWLIAFAVGAAILTTIATVAPPFAATGTCLYGWLWGSYCKDQIEGKERRWHVVFAWALIAGCIACGLWCAQAWASIVERREQRDRNPTVNIRSEGAVTITHGTERIRVEVAK